MGVATRIAAGAVVSAAVGAAAYRLRALTASGAWAAAACGTILYGAGGWPWVALVGFFFVSSSALTRIEPATRARPHRSQDHAGRRWHQVAANGGAAALTACAYALSGSPLAFVAGAGAVAVATADTWATEVGRLSAFPPVLITNGRPVSHGASGGVTIAGSAAACAGALLVAWIGAVLARHNPGAFTVAVTAAGVSGAMLDSVLGATVEVRCSWIGNGIVNFAATAWGALTAVALVRWWM
ncbi:MAG TPA: DUF92 domain-containing protein [bacterium]|nr:DUF92 domain-containing protein [bacterium]